MREVLTVVDARRWAAMTRAALAARRAEIDRLNVYPVPDGDTGTNLYLTFDGALDAAAAEHARTGADPERTLAGELMLTARASLLSARGNSGVILSQIIRGFAEVVAEDDADQLDAPLLVAALGRAAARAREAVAHPQEGTVLTVADRVAEAAAGLGPDAALGEVTAAALAAARSALAATPTQLQALADAGVVDAGAVGYVLLIEALHRLVTEDTSTWVRLDEAERRRALGSVPTPTRHADSYAGGPAYEVMYLVRDSTEERIAALRARLDRLGDSLLVVGGPDLWNVHVHVDDPGAAVEAAVETGVPYRIRITHLGAQVGPAERSAVAVVACAAGPGIAETLAAAGAIAVPSGPGSRASAGRLLDAARQAHAETVILLPNDADTLLAAQAAARAARDEGFAIRVVRSRTAVQGLAALAMFDPEQSADDNAVAMAEAAAATKHGAVTIADREGLTSAGHCQVGDVLGVVDGDFAIIGADLRVVANEVLQRLLTSGGELVTIVSGADAEAGLAADVERTVKGLGRSLEVTVVEGRQPRYPLLLGVE